MINRRRLLAGAALCAVPATAAIALSPRAAGANPSVRQTRIGWLENHAHRLRSLDIVDDDFSDLEPLARAIGDSRIVTLGEQTHGDGTTLRAKARFVRFLHERMGFDVLAFESGLYDVHKVWQHISAGGNARTFARQGIYGIWSVSEQVQSLFDYVGARARSTRPLQLAGFDCKATGAPAAWLIDDLVGFLTANGIKIESLADWPRLREQLVQMASWKWEPSAADRDLIHAALDGISDRIATLEGTDAAFWRQIFKGMKSYAAFWSNMAAGTAGAADVAMRDAAMGDNLIWLAREAFAGRKVIVWAATFHNVRNLHLIGDSNPYSQIKTMGHVAWEALGDTIYNVAFLGYEGRTAWANGGYREMELERPPRDSLEDLWGETSHDNAFVDLRHVAAGGEWLKTRLTARPTGPEPLEADMSQLFDAAVFLRKMEPSTRATEPST
jgi:erythromycin esterase